MTDDLKSIPPPFRRHSNISVEDSEQEGRSLSRLDGKNSVSLIVQKQSGTNTVDVVKLLRESRDER